MSKIKPLYISHFPTIRTKEGNNRLAVEEVFRWIRRGVQPVDQLIPMLRAETDKKKRTALKAKLPAVTWSGTFSTRNKEGLEEHSGLICIDLDDIAPQELQEKRAEIMWDHRVYALFISPSGNGLKVLFKTLANGQTHEQYFDALTGYLVNYFGVVVDTSGRDVSRLCFLSHDPELYLNKDYAVLGPEFLAEYAPAREPKPVQPLTEVPKATVGMNYLDKCDEIARKTHQPAPGSYNFYMTTFSIFANRYGLDQDEVIFYLQSNHPSHDQKETAATVRSTYAKFSAESGQWLRSTRQPAKRQAQGKAKKAEKPEPAKPGMANDSVQFWYEVQNQTTGKIEYKFSYDDAIEFLQNNGFYRLPMDNDYYQFIHVREDIKQVEVIQPIKIKDFFLTYLKSEENSEFKAVREMFRRGAKNYCSINLLDGLNYYKPTFKKDARDTSYVYFRNCYLEITAHSITEKPYSSLENFIWSKQVIDFDYRRSDYGESDFARFVSLAILGKKIPLAELEPVQISKLESFSTTMGYLLHRYKNPALTKAVVAVDKKLRTAGENNGRTGKSLLSKALAKMLNVCLIDGKNFKFDSPFPFQKANIDTELINFNDVLKNFDFERLFGMITEEFTFEKKGKDSITMPFEDAPKFYISTNTTLKGAGESNRGRQQIIEFDNYFNADHTPVMEFGRMFFYDWDEDEYCRFYTYMIECIQYFLKNGLIDFPLENYAINKLIDSAGEEFVDYMNENVLDQLQYKKEFEAHKLYEAYISQHRHKDKTHIKTFNKNVKAWAEVKNLDINIHKPYPHRDRRNGVDYFTFTLKIQNDHD